MKKRVRTLVPINAREGRIPAGWEGEEEYRAKGINGEPLIFVRFEATAALVGVHAEEIEDAKA